MLFSKPGMSYFVLSVFGLGAVYPAYAQEFESPQRSFDGDVAELDQMAQHCSDLRISNSGRDFTKAQTEALYACAHGCGVAAKAMRAGQSREKSGTKRALTLCLNGYDTVLAQGIKPGSRPKQERGTIGDVTGDLVDARAITTQAVSRDRRSVNVQRIEMTLGGVDNADWTTICDSRATVMFAVKGDIETPAAFAATVARVKILGVSYQRTTNLASGESETNCISNRFEIIARK